MIYRKFPNTASLPVTRFVLRGFFLAFQDVNAGAARVGGNKRIQCHIDRSIAFIPSTRSCISGKYRPDTADQFIDKCELQIQ